MSGRRRRAASGTTDRRARRPLFAKTFGGRCIVRTCRAACFPHGRRIVRAAPAPAPAAGRQEASRRNRVDRLVRHLQRAGSLRRATVSQAPRRAISPACFAPPLTHAVSGRCFPARSACRCPATVARGLWSLRRATSRPWPGQSIAPVDDTPAGGGAGMVCARTCWLRPSTPPRPSTIPSPACSCRRGKTADAGARPRLAAGRARSLLRAVRGASTARHQARDREVSIGDYVLFVGRRDRGARAIDACVRLIPGVMGAAARRGEDFENCLLEYPTPPAGNSRRESPKILLSGTTAGSRPGGRPGGKLPGTTAGPAEKSSEKGPDRVPARTPAPICIGPRQLKTAFPNARPGTRTAGRNGRIFSMDIIAQLDAEQVKKLARDIPEFQPGDTVIVNVKVKKATARASSLRRRRHRPPGRRPPRASPFAKISYGEGVGASSRCIRPTSTRSRSCVAARCVAPILNTCAIVAASRRASPGGPTARRRQGGEKAARGEAVKSDQQIAGRKPAISFARRRRSPDRPGRVDGPVRRRRSLMASDLRRVSRALISVSDKTGLIDFARALVGHGVELVSTGGTRKALADAGLKGRRRLRSHRLSRNDGRRASRRCIPRCSGGLLAIRENPEHEAAMLAHNIPQIDLLVVNLYPFEATIAKNAPYEGASRTSTSAGRR